jgi:outer membrane biosynthesis protein TonB
MSVEASEFTTEVWTRWQGHLINGSYPLGRILGGSEQSGVFLTRSQEHGSAELVIKLIPTNRALAESQLRRWKRAARLEHPHLLRLIEWGGCQLDGLPYVFTVMEYADQTLAQLLRNRALTDEEVQEMLPTLLEALAFLHGRGLVHGQLKPANILVVGDQLKLASDTIRRVSEGTLSATVTPYDAPECGKESSSTAGDVWALGITLCEALTRRPPAAFNSDSREAVTLPAGFSGTFRELIERCLSMRPQQRPEVADLLAWAREGKSLPPPPVAIQPEPVVVLPATTASTAPPKREPALVPAQADAAPITGNTGNPRAMSMVIGAAVLLAAVWGAVRVFGGHAAPASPSVATTAATPTQLQNSAAPIAAPRTSTAAAATASAARPASAASGALHQVIPDVPWSARRTIRGHIKVWVRVIVNRDGTVFAATPDRSGPSRYFQHLATDAAEQWTFAPGDTDARRLMQVRFDFGRDGTTGHVVALH